MSNIVLLLYFTVFVTSILCHKNTELLPVETDINLWVITKNSSFILPSDDGLSNWGDRIEHCAAEYEKKQKLIYKQTYVNSFSNVQNTYKFEKRVTANIIITEVRFINIARQRGFVKYVTVKRHQLNEDCIEAEIVALPNKTFRIVTEIYAYDPNSGRGISNSKILLILGILITILKY